MPLIEDMRRYGRRWLADDAEPRPRRRLGRTSSPASARPRAGAGAPRRGAEAGDVRDFLLNEALKRLAADAAVRLSALVAGGEQIPFDVAEEDGPESAFYLYEPRTSRFVLEREEELRGAARLRPGPRRGRRRRSRRPLPGGLRREGPRRPARARRADADRLPRLASGRAATEFSLDRERLETALAVLDAEARDADEAEVLIAPVVGLKMAPPSLQLPHGVRLIRADAIESPVEAMRSEGMGRAAWEPQFLAVAEQDDEPDSAAIAIAPAARADQRHAPLQGRRHRPRPLRLRSDGTRPLEPDRDRRPRHPPGRLPAEPGRRRAARRLRRRPRRAAPTPTAPSPGPSPASRWAARARARSRASATTCSPCAPCSRGTARSAPRCRCAPRR